MTPSRRPLLVSISRLASLFHVLPAHLPSLSYPLQATKATNTGSVASLSAADKRVYDDIIAENPDLKTLDIKKLKKNGVTACPTRSATSSGSRRLGALR